jgi:hypothetical protein
MSTTVRNSAGGSYIAVALTLLSVAGNVLAADLIGVVLRGGAPSPGTSVNLQYKDADAGKTTSDGAGRFVIRNLRPGVYKMRCGEGPVVLVRINDGLNEINCQG